MAIDINGINNGQTHSANESAQSRPVRQEPTSAQRETGVQNTGDTVSVTDTAHKLKEIERGLESVPVVDTQRVETIRAAIANGEYEIDPERIAESMIATERPSDHKASS